MAKGEQLEPTPYQTLAPHADVQQWRNAFAAVQQRLRTLEGRTAHTSRIDDLQTETAEALMIAKESRHLLQELGRQVITLASKIERLEKDLYARELADSLDEVNEPVAVESNPYTGVSEEELPVEVLPEE